MALAIGAIERSLEILAKEVRGDEQLSQEFTTSIEVFFRGPGPTGGVAETLLAGRRHLEWFLVEFHSPSLRGLVAEKIEDRYQHIVAAIGAGEGEAVEVALGHAFDALLRSHTGIFEVEEVRQGAGAWLRDVTGFGSFALGDEALAKALRDGELIVGRLYPAGDGLHLASPAATVMKPGSVTTALRHDLQAIRDRGGSNIVRLNQAELEVMFFGRAPGAATESEAPEPDVDPEEAAYAALLAAGFDEERARAAMGQLRQHPRDPENLVHGGSDVMGAILEELAFDTEIDLEAARRALLGAWEALSTETDEPGPATGGGAGEDANEGAAEGDEGQRARAIDAFAEGRSKGGDPTELLRTLERDLGIEGDAPDADGDMPAPDFPGVVGAMIDEMRWEFGATESSFDAASLEPLRHLATFAKPIGVFEELRGHDLFQFATFWLQEKQALTSDAEAVALVEALRRFCDWALDAHEVDLGSEFLDALDGLETSLPRLRRLNQRIDPGDRQHGLEETGDPWAVVNVAPEQPAAFEQSADRVRTSGGDELTVIFPEALRAELSAGDRLRGHIELTGEARVYCAYPPEAAALTTG